MNWYLKKKSKRNDVRKKLNIDEIKTKQLILKRLHYYRCKLCEWQSPNKGCCVKINHHLDRWRSGTRERVPNFLNYSTILMLFCFKCFHMVTRFLFIRIGIVNSSRLHLLFINLSFIKNKLNKDIPCHCSYPLLSLVL